MNQKRHLLIGAIIILSVLMGCIDLARTNETVVEDIPDDNTVTWEKETKVVREPAVAGTFYPNSEVDLDEMVTYYFDKAEEGDIPGIKALVSPHAGFIYSGGVAAEGFKQIGGIYKHCYHPPLQAIIFTLKERLLPMSHTTKHLLVK